MRRRHPLLFWLGAFLFMRHFLRRGRHMHGGYGYRRHGHDHYDYV